MTEEEQAISDMLDRMEGEYPSLTRDELEILFHAVYEDLAAQDLDNVTTDEGR